MNIMLIFWGILVVVFGIMEGITAQLVSIWFVLGSLAALIASCAGAPTKIYKRITNAEKILDPNTSTYDKVKSGVKIIGSSKRNISSPAKDINNTVFTIIDAIRDLAA